MSRSAPTRRHRRRHRRGSRLQGIADPAFLVEQVVGLMLVRFRPASERMDDRLRDDLVDGDQPRQLAERRVPVGALALQHALEQPLDLPVLVGQQIHHVLLA
jgi:hypothetical protein